MQAEPGAAVYPGAPTYGAPPTQPPYAMPPTYGAPPSIPLSPMYPPYAGAPTYGAPPSMPLPPGQSPYGAPYGPPYGAPGGYPGAYMPGSNWHPTSQRKRRPWLGIVIATLGGLVMVAVIVTAIFNLAGLRTVSRVTFSGVSSAQATATAPRTTLLSDPLTSATSGWSADTSHCYFASDGYHVEGGYLCFAPIGVQTDGTESVTAKVASGATNHGYGLVFRRASRGNYYMFVIDANSKFAVFKVVNGTLSTLAPFAPSDAIKGGLNTANSLSVTMNGSTFDCYVNGTKVATVHDSTFTEGLWGLGGALTDDIVFTNYLAQR